MNYLQVKVFKKENRLTREENQELVGIFAAESKEACMELVRKSLKLSFSAREGEWEDMVDLGTYKQLAFSPNDFKRAKEYKSIIFVVDGINIITEVRHL